MGRPRLRDWLMRYAAVEESMGVPVGVALEKMNHSAARRSNGEMTCSGRSSDDKVRGLEAKTAQRLKIHNAQRRNGQSKTRQVNDA